MYDTGKIIAGLLVFLLVITLPFWYNLATGKAGYTPELERPTDARECVRDSAYMAAHHMDLLNVWRDQVVRQGARFETGSDGQRRERSLTRTCLGCHASKERFCDRCHSYMGVQPYCWDCHIAPEEPRP
ncbi:MAG: sulfate reduction electron transfer complex DsrMKJOP subunit DsrJ [Candidatus Zixiibacteriota bacterium]